MTTENERVRVNSVRVRHHVKMSRSKSKVVDKPNGGAHEAARIQRVCESLLCLAKARSSPRAPAAASLSKRLIRDASGDA